VRTAADFLVYLLLRTTWGLMARIPLAPLRRALEGIGVIASRVDRRRRIVIRDNLRIAFADWADDRANATVEQSFRNWGRIVAEVVHARDFVAGAGPWVGRAEAALSELQRDGRGVLVLTAHTGNFELMARLWGLASGHDIWVLHRPMSNRFVDEFLVAERARANVRSLGRGAGLRGAVRVLAEGGVVAIPLDQNQPPLRPGVFVDFFGRRAATATILARLSLACRVPVLPVFAAWQGDAVVADLGEPIWPPAVGADERARVVDELTGRYSAAIERAVRLHPEQWNWAHRRWKTRPATAGRPVRSGLSASANGGAPKN